MKNKYLSLIIVLILFVRVGFAAEKIQSSTVENKQTSQQKIDFPYDHLPHLNKKKELWRFTGTLSTDKGESYNYIFVLNREGEIYNVITQVISLSDNKKVLFREFHTDTGSFKEKLTFRVGKAFITYNKINDSWTFGIDDSQYGFNLRAKAIRPYALNQLKTASKRYNHIGKSYYSAQDMTVNGTLTLEGKSVFVTGKHTWLDHFWFTPKITPQHYANQWFSCRFDNNSGLLMEFQVNKYGQAIASSKTAIFQDRMGAQPLNRFYLNALGRSINFPNSQFKFPINWRVSVPRLKMRFNLKADVDEQWITSNKGPSFYAGSASIYDSEQKGYCFFGLELLKPIQDTKPSDKKDNQHAA